MKMNANNNKSDSSPGKLKPSKRAVEAAKYKCPVELSIRIIGGKWKSVILWNIKERTMRFGELKREISGITVKMLAQQLRELEQDGIISRKMYYEVPPRVEYSLTETGKSLIPILQVLADWGMKYKEIYMG